MSRSGHLDEPCLHILVVDDEQPVLDELTWLLERDEHVGSITTAMSGAEAAT